MQVRHIEGGTSRKCCPPRLTAATIFTGETDLQAVWSFEQGQAALLDQPFPKRCAFHGSAPVDNKTVSARSEPLNFELLTGITERRKSLLQEVAQHWHAKKITGCAFIVSAGRLFADFCPIAGGIVFPTDPCQGH